MASINGYKYLSEEEAINARESVDKFYGIPVNETDITQNWVDYEVAQYDNPVFWYIPYYSSLLPILGQPITFEVAPPPFPA